MKNLDLILRRKILRSFKILSVLDIKQLYLRLLLIEEVLKPKSK